MEQEKVELNGSHNVAETTLEDDDDLENRLEDAGLIKPPDGMKFNKSVVPKKIVVAWRGHY
jgi:hypothetical protein